MREENFEGDVCEELSVRFQARIETIRQESPGSSSRQDTYQTDNNERADWELFDPGAIVVASRS